MDEPLLFNATRSTLLGQPRLAPGPVLFRHASISVVEAAAGTLAFVVWLRLIPGDDTFAVVLGAVLWVFYVGGLLAVCNVFGYRAYVDSTGLELHRHGLRTRFVPWSDIADVAIVEHGSVYSAEVLEEPHLRAWVVPFSDSSSASDPDLVRLMSLFRAGQQTRSSGSPAWTSGDQVGRVRVFGYGDMMSPFWLSSLSLFFPIYIVSYTLGHAVGDTAATVASVAVVIASVALLLFLRRGTAVEADSTGIFIIGRLRRRFLPWTDITAIDSTDIQESVRAGAPASALVITLSDDSKYGVPLRVGIVPPQFADKMIQRLLTQRPAPTSP